MPNQSNMRATHDNAGIAANSDVKAKADITSYEKAEKFLDGRNDRLLASSMIVRRASWNEGILPSPIEIVLYDTPIVVYYPDETFEVRTGGFRTPTTRSRITQFTPERYHFNYVKKVLRISADRGYADETEAEGTRWPVAP